MNTKGDRILLKCGHKFSLSGINVLIGPNNSGKSTLLREVAGDLRNTKIVEDITPKVWNEESVKEFARQNGRPDFKYVLPAPSGGEWRKDNWDSLKPIFEHNRDEILKHSFRLAWSREATVLGGSKRLGIVIDQDYDGIASAEGNPKNLFNRVRANKEIRNSIRKYVGEVLVDQTFCLWTPKTTKLRAFIAHTEPPESIEYADSPEALKFFQSQATPLADYSDGICAYVGIIVNVIAEPSSMFLIDEPEAFLHPSLCFLLGKALQKISKEKGIDCICATHSPHFLRGLLASDPSTVSVTRLTYENSKASAKTISSEDLLSIIRDPLLNSLGVTEALFHSRVVVGEGDSDRSFYSEINNRLLDFTHVGISNCLFINAQNKQTIARIISLLRGVGVPAAAITDVDVFKEGGVTFSRICEAVGLRSANKKAVETLRSSVHTALSAAA
ncbi:MAG: ATP-binding protein, partial [Verrucomicrobiales bacterium]|nr:ATP-binding protein [Verrucomicrobiales bacterium]